MSDTLTLNPRKAQKRETILKKILWIIIGGLFFISLAEIAFQLFIVPNLHIKQITVESDFPIGRDEILGAAGIGGNEYYFSLDVEGMRKRLEGER